jgi:hypothetical protein
MKNSKGIMNIPKAKCDPMPVHAPQFYMKLPEKENEVL